MGSKTHRVHFKDLDGFCAEFVKELTQKTVVLLDGPLGVGKTQFVKSVVKALGGETPDSPTFSIINCYQAPQFKIYHGDLYRLESAEDIESTGFWDLFLEDQNVIFVEWAEKIQKDDWPKMWKQKKVEMSFTEDQLLRQFVIESST